MHTVENTRPSLLRVGGREILPGKNLLEIDDLLDPKKAKDPRAAKWSKAFYLWAGKGWLKWSKVKAGDKAGVEPPATLADTSEEAAVAIVKAETDQQILARWMAADKRTAVQGAIRARFAELA